MRRILRLLLVLSIDLYCFFSSVSAITKEQIPNCTQIGDRTDCNGLTMVEVNHSKYGLIEDDGSYLIPPVYERLLRHLDCDSLFFVDKDKDIHIYRCGYRHFHWVKKPNNKYDVEDNNYQNILEADFDEVNFFDSIYAVVMRKNGIYGYVDTLGGFHRLLDEYEIHKYDDYYFLLVKDGKYGLANEKFEVIVPAEYDSLIPYTQFEKAVAKKNGQYGLISFENKIFMPFVYDSLIPYLEKDKVIVKKNRRFGIYWYNDSIIQPCHFDTVEVIDGRIRGPIKRKKSVPSWENYIVIEEGFEGNIKKSPVIIDYIIDEPDNEVYYLERPRFLVSVRGHRFILDENGKDVLAKEIFDWKDYKYCNVHGSEIDAINKANPIENQMVHLHINYQQYIVPKDVENVKLDKETGTFIVTNRHNNNKGVLNKKAEVIVPIEYDDIIIDRVEAKYNCFNGGLKVKMYNIR